MRNKEETGCGEEEGEETRQVRKKEGTGCKEEEGVVTRG